MIPEAVSTLKQLAGLSQAREAHYRSDGPDTGSNSGWSGTTTKNINKVEVKFVWKILYPLVNRASQDNYFLTKNYK